MLDSRYANGFLIHLPSGPLPWMVKFFNLVKSSKSCVTYTGGTFDISCNILSGATAGKFYSDHLLTSLPPAVVRVTNGGATSRILDERGYVT